MNDIQIESRYNATLDYLYSFVDYSLTRAFRYSADKFNLERMVNLLDLLGNPQNDYRIVHIAGTKGKGSTAVFCSTALKEANYKVGLYTSPHLEDYCERVQVDGEPISHLEISDLVDQIKPHVAAVPELTTFEITTAIGFLYFSLKKVDIVVAEVGLGGRLDATNVVTPMVSVITSISYDHTNILGNTLKEIAGEKAGIIKYGVPVVCSPQTKETLDVFERISKERSAPLTLVGRDVMVMPVSHSLNGQSLYIWTQDEQEKMDDFMRNPATSGWKPQLFQIPLLGRHQLDNAATAYATLQIVKQYGIRLSKTEITRGFRKVHWPARFEIINTKPLLIIDSAHNRDSASKLMATIDEYLPDRKIIIIFGASEDKDIEGILTELKPRIYHLFITKSEHPRAEEPHIIFEKAKKLGLNAIMYETVESALVEAFKLYGDETGIVATGSIFIAAATRAVFKRLEKEKLE